MSIIDEETYEFMMMEDDDDHENERERDDYDQFMIENMEQDEIEKKKRRDTMSMLSRNHPASLLFWRNNRARLSAEPTVFGGILIGRWSQPSRLRGQL